VPWALQEDSKGVEMEVEMGQDEKERIVPRGLGHVSRRKRIISFALVGSQANAIFGWSMAPPGDWLHCWAVLLNKLMSQEQEGAKSKSPLKFSAIK